MMCQSMFKIAYALISQRNKGREKGLGRFGCCIRQAADKGCSSYALRILKSLLSVVRFVFINGRVSSLAGLKRVKPVFKEI